MKTLTISLSLQAIYGGLATHVMVYVKILHPSGQYYPVAALQVVSNSIFNTLSLFL